MYEYNARLVKVVDGDTVHAEVDLGCDIHIFLSLRLNGLNCAEKGTIAGDLATSFTRNWFEIQCPDGFFILKTRKDKREKYGRYLADIWSVGEKSLNQMLLESGNAATYDGGKRA